MIYYILLLLSLCLGVSKNIISKWGEKSFGFLNGLMSVNIITSIVALFVFATGISGIGRAISPLFFLMAFLYGIFTLASQSFYITAVKGGSVSICSLIYASCFIIPTIYSVIRNGETVGLYKGLGIAFMIFSVILVSLKNNTDKNFSQKSIKYALLAMCSAGSVGILQKEFGNIYPQNLLDTFLLLAFFFMLIASVMFKIFISTRIKKQSVIYNKLFFIPAVLLSLSVVFANKLNLILVANIPGIIFFPLINGGTIMLSAISSGIFFKEKITARIWTGITIGIVAIILIAL